MVNSVTEDRSYIIRKSGEEREVQKMHCKGGRERKGGEDRHRKKVARRGKKGVIDDTGSVGKKPGEKERQIVNER